MNRARLAQRRAEAIAAVLAGERVGDVAKRLRLTSHYVYVIVRRAGHHVPKRPKPEPKRSARRREAKVRELVALGLTYRRIAELLDITRQSAFIICKRLGIKAVRDNTGWLPAIKLGRSRAEVMAALYRDGYTLQQIGDQYHLTRERVRQLLTKHLGFNRMSGGAHKVALQNEAARLERLNDKSLIKHGCTWEQYVALRDMKKPTRAFHSQQQAAHNRGIGWELTLWQWWTIWQESGHWHQRGRGQGYVMCRKGDEGPYAIGNVFIATAAQNSSEGSKKDRSLPLGVKRAKTSGKFIAVRMVDSKKLYLGTFQTPELAHAAYLRAAPQQGVAA